MPADNPFIGYRTRLDVHGHALAKGLGDADYKNLVREADTRLAEIAGTGFRTTPLIELDTPLNRPVYAKVETGNVGGSHKARHLFGLLIRLLIDEPNITSRELAIASCGNAALGAANVAKAAGARLRVFVPTDANPAVMSELDRLDAIVETCPRQPGVDGDPCMHALDQAISDGSVPFTVQGPTCPDVIDGGRTLGLELATQLRSAGISPTDLYIQVGGGALATATMDGLERGGTFMPRLHPAQPEVAHPYVAAWERLVALGGAVGDQAALVEDHPELMTPWPSTPQSVASGILDDITYDWVTVMKHQIASGGWPVLVPEETFVTATELVANQTEPSADPTGASGLAGLLADPKGDLPGAGPALVILSGRSR